MHFSSIELNFEADFSWRVDFGKVQKRVELLILNLLENSFGVLEPSR